ncbi:MAG: macro domain-containing protein [Spirulina sp. SIO3F2]|nr:macro domain-containing protein [Spirulina sp. SIO3F2]
MVIIHQGDLLQAPAEALVNPVNCVGVMGKGLALQFKRQFPDNFQKYKQACAEQMVQPGKMLTISLPNDRHPHYIINFPTKRHWRSKSRLEDIQTGLADLIATVERLKIQSIAIPPLGCGLGGLSWAIVKPLVVDAFAAVPEVQVLLFDPVI